MALQAVFLMAGTFCFVKIDMESARAKGKT